MLEFLVVLDSLNYFISLALDFTSFISAGSLEQTGKFVYFFLFGQRISDVNRLGLVIQEFGS